MSFGETFNSRISPMGRAEHCRVAPEEIDAKAEDALKVQTIIEGIIESWETGKVVTLSY